MYTRYPQHHPPPSHPLTAADAASSYYSLHHLTTLPSSVQKFTDATFSQSRIERALHSRMEQFTNRDSDRFRQLLKWIKNKQAIRPDIGNNNQSSSSSFTPQSTALLEESSTGVSLIRKSQFQNILEVLGVFSTQEQASALFDKYDVEKKGFLTLHELMCRASSALERDHAGATGSGSGATTSRVVVSEIASGSNEGKRSDDMFANKGKKQFLRLKLTGEGERPITPKQNAALITVPLIVRALREKLRINAPVGVTQSIPRARREFARVFEYYDTWQNGSLTMEQLVRALHQVNFPLGAPHLKLLMEAFPSAAAGNMQAQQQQQQRETNNYNMYNLDRYDKSQTTSSSPTSQGGFDFVSFILYVFPDSSLNSNSTGSDNPSSTSLYLNHELGREFFDRMSVEERRKRGLPPTHEQWEEMKRKEREVEEEERRKLKGGGGYGYDVYDEEEKQQSSSNEVNILTLNHHPHQPSQPPRISQFARERAPPTPQLPLSMEQHYLNIAKKQPSEQWVEQNRRNVYVQSVVGVNGGSERNTPRPVTSTSVSSTAANGNGNQTARTYRDIYGAGAGFNPTLTSAPQQHAIRAQLQQQRAFTPSAATSELAHAVQHLSASGALPLNPHLLNGGGIHTPRLGTPSGDASFSTILSTPTPQRRPKTGIVTYVRGGTGKQLPPVPIAAASRSGTGSKTAR